MTKQEEEDRKKRPLPPLVEESNSIGIDAGDATSGAPKTPEEWSKEQPIEDGPTYALEPGDPTPFQTGAGTPERKSGGTEEEKKKEKKG